MQVTIEQSNIIAKQGRQLLIIIQEKNWPKIKQFLNKKLDVEISLSTKED